MRFTVGALLVLVVLAGCNQTVTQPKSALAEGCLLNSDCAEPLVCVYRRCYQPCASRRDCPAGSDCQVSEAPYSVCTQGDCVGKACPTGQSCGSDNQCHAQCIANGQCLAEQVCVAGLCINAADFDAGVHPTSCVYDSECPTGSVCLADGRCGPQCRDVRDCTAGQSCTAGKCTDNTVPTDAGVGCRYTSDCLAPSVCRASQCVAECLTTRDCAAGKTCQGSACITPSVDGGAGMTCAYNSDCVLPLACIAGACAPECLTSRDCAAGLVCQAGQCLGPVVDAGVSDGGATALCNYTSDCAVGQKCVTGTCVDECHADRDCSAGFSCVANRCVLPGVDGGAALDGGSVCLLNSDCRIGYRCGPLGVCIPECVTARDCSAGYDCVAQRCLPAGLTADSGVPAGFGTPCNFQSTCAPWNLVCGATGVCIYECLADRDCATTSGFCCRSTHCVAGSACVVVPDAGVDAGVRDAGVSDGGCSADIQCLDNDFCNGAERCLAGRCSPGNPPCADNNPCTVDLCDNTLKTCSYQTLAVDVDQDQHYPIACGGTADDCDDNDALTFPGALERCDFKDNNCNGAVDEGLWTEELGARGAISVSGAYLPASGPPAVVKSATDVVVFAAADTTTGSLDAWRLSLADLSNVAGPVSVEGSSSAWSSCVPNASFPSIFILGKRVARPLVSTFGDQLFVSANVGSYVNPQATCCQTGEALASRVMGLQVTAATLTTPLRRNLVTRSDTGCTTARADVNAPAGLLYDRASAAWSVHLNKWVAAWWSREVGTEMNLRFATMTSAGVVSADRPVFDVPGAAAVNDVSSPWCFSSPRVAVGNNTVLYVWTNTPYQPYTGHVIRWALFDADLTSVVAGPFELGTFPTTNQAALVNLQCPKIENAVFDGTNYVLTLNPQTNVTTNVGLADGRVRFLSINEAGAIVANKPTFGSPAATSATSNGYCAGTQPAVAVVSQGKGVVAAVANGTNIRFGWGASSPDAGYLSTEVAIGTAQTARTDAVLVPLSDTRVGLIWSDGNLQRTIMRCGP